MLMIQDIGRTVKPNVNNNTYNDLISTGNSNLIRNEDVLNQMYSYYKGISYEWFDEYIDRLWKGYLPLAIEAIDMETHQQIIDFEGTQIEQELGEYNIEVSHRQMVEAFNKLRAIEEMKFESKNVARTHLIHKKFMLRMKESAAELLNALSEYQKEL